MKIIIYFLTLLFLVQCNSKENSTLSVKRKLSHLSDSSFVTDVRSIDFYKGHYFISDNKRGQILELDSALEIKSTFGSLGSKDGEFKGLTRFSFCNDTIFAINHGKKKIECFTFDYPKSVKTIAIPEDMAGTRLDFRFFVTDKRIFLSTPETGKTISSFDRSGILREQVGDVTEYASHDPFDTAIRNIKWLFSTGNRMISVSDVSPEIQALDFSGQVIYKHKINENQSIDERTKFISKQPVQEHVTYSYFRDVYLSNDKLYLLCITGKEKGALNANTVLIFDLIDDKPPVFRNEIQLPGRWYASICVNDKHILAFESTKNELQLIKL
ncbi:MAG: hypothetical protein HY015_02315 [Bacteroidetes bacterium]|nr:hypothetical protein [Bacteroidota bacterium]MBI3481805.1 hypothetical protein [Bacteroidota bacterium]